MNDSEGRGNWPRVDEFATPVDSRVGVDAVRARFDPSFNVGPHFVPIESEADAMQGFEGH